VPRPQYLTFVVVVAMDEHCSLEHVYACQERRGTFFFSVSTLIHDIAMTKTAVLQDYKGIYGRGYLTYTKWKWSPLCTVLRQGIPVAPVLIK
jgi:hypothetical protein